MPDSEAAQRGVGKQEVADVYPILYHYTTEAGLEGIIRSQQLWATGIAHLNDAEEHVGFFDRRLPNVIEGTVEQAFSDLMRTPKGKRMLDQVGGLEVAVAQFKKIVGAMKETSLEMNDPYVISLCGPPPEDPEDGLLSQWRGYGADGGYVVVLRTAELGRLLAVEERAFFYLQLLMGDVEYHRGDADKPTHPENRENETTIQKCVREFIFSWKAKAFNRMFGPVTYLSCMHKHRGFREEREVRVVALRPKGAMAAEMRRQGDKRLEKPVLMRGAGVPYISLFGGELRLPIERVIVGPHRDKHRRQAKVESLLKAQGIAAPVSVSGIPYLGC